jgi:hypothetical protein
MFFCVGKTRNDAIAFTAHPADGVLLSFRVVGRRFTGKRADTMTPRRFAGTVGSLMVAYQCRRAIAGYRCGMPAGSGRATTRERGFLAFSFSCAAAAGALLPAWFWPLWISRSTFGSAIAAAMRADTGKV